MALEPINGSLALPPATRTKRRQTGFAVPDAGEAAEADPAADAPSEASAAASVPLLTLQAAGMAEAQAEADRAAARQAEGVLGAMRGVQLAMLGGGDMRHALARLADTLPHATDPVLNAVLQAIAQRAAIEIVRLG